MAFRSYDDNVVFNLMGGPSIPDRTQPESIRVVDLKGLIPPWKSVEQKGATQDGSTWVDALYDPMDVEMVVDAVARNPVYHRKLIRDWIEAWDVKEEGELSWFTHQLGRWWAPVRWAKPPGDSLKIGDHVEQRFTWNAKAYDAFWRSYDCVDSFRFDYKAAFDEFIGTYSNGLGTDWDIVYSGAGSGIVYSGTGTTTFGEVQSNIIDGHTAVCRRASFATATNNQAVDIRIGRFTQSWWHPTESYVDVWARMNTSGTVGANGIRLRIGHGTVKLSRFVSSVETVLKQINLRTKPNQTNTRYVLICGWGSDARLYKVYRDGALLLTCKEIGTASMVGSGYRGAGFGVHSDAPTAFWGRWSNNHPVPPTVRAWACGDNSTGTQSGFVGLTNVGDQPMWPRFTCFGPGTFTFAAAPGAVDYVQFGPLLENQVMQVRSDPRKRGVIDLTSTPPSPQEAAQVNKALEDVLNFATAGGAPALLESLTTKFGVTTAQGNPYSLLDGRFSTPIPPKPTGKSAQTVHIQVAIAGGNADSQIIAAGTPLRRYPL